MTDFVYAVAFDNSEYTWDEVTEWLDDKVGKDNWSIWLYGAHAYLFKCSILFKCAEDAIMFKLKFGDLQ